MREVRRERWGRKEAKESKGTAGSGWVRNKMIPVYAFKIQHSAKTRLWGCRRTSQTESSQEISGKGGPSKPNK